MKPFSQLCQDRAKSFPDAEIVNRAFGVLAKWSVISSGKLVSLDEVAWVGALMYKSGLMAMTLARESTNEHGARVVTMVAEDGIKTADGAG